VVTVVTWPPLISSEIATVVAPMAAAAPQSRWFLMRNRIFVCLSAATAIACHTLRRYCPGLDDEDEWAAMLLSRWPVLRDDFVRGPPSAEARESA
jgi:hypothetical protein